MYFIIDLHLDPPEKIVNLEFTKIDDACQWIDSTEEECPICRYTIIEE